MKPSVRTRHIVPVDREMRLLHLIKDEKFPDAAYEVFEAIAPGQNTFMLGSKRPIQLLEKVVPKRVSRFAYLNPRFIRALNCYDAIILHSLHDFALEILARIDPAVPVVWIGMGHDYYDLLNDSPWELLKPETTALVASYKPNFGRLGPANPLKRMLMPILYPNALRKKELLNKIDLFAPVLKSEYFRLSEKLRKLHPAFITWNYGKTAELVDGHIGTGTVTGCDILVGNSATPTNNHIEAFSLLAKVALPDGARVVVPLSYGDQEYRLRIIQEGKRLFGERFRPVTEIMSLKNYIEMLRGCSTVVMNHLRQQAAGNLIISLFLGARVYLDPRNPLYEEYRNQGLVVRNINNLANDQSLLGFPLDAPSINVNRKILQSFKGRAFHEDNTRQLINALARIKTQKALDIGVDG